MGAGATGRDAAPPVVSTQLSKRRGPAPLRWLCPCARSARLSLHTSSPLENARLNLASLSEDCLGPRGRRGRARQACSGCHSRREVAPVDSEERTFPRCSSSRWGAPSPYRTLGPRSRAGCARGCGGKTVGLPSVCYLKYGRQGTSPGGMTPAPTGPMSCYKWGWEPAQNDVGMTAVPLPKVIFHFI